MKAKMTLLVVAIVAASSFALARMALQGLLDLLETGLAQRAESVAHVYIDEVDPAWFQSVSVPNITDAELARLSNKFTKLTDLRYVTRIELIRFAGPLSIEHILSVPFDDSPDYRSPGTREDVPPGDSYDQHRPGHAGVSLASGPAMSGWLPIMKDGKDQGLLIVYIDAADTQHAINTAVIALLVTMIVVTILSGILTYKASATFEKIAVTDGLMGIYNHKFFKQRLEQEVAKSARYAQQTSLVMCDLDFFKRVNDTYGHATGDLVLKQLARWVTDTARNTDVVARYGGEEIGIILTHTGVAGAQEFAERLRLKVSQQVIKDPEEDAEFRVTISIGVAQWEKGVNMLDLIKRADAALYHSKHQGRNRVTIYQEDILPAPEPQTKTGS